MTVKFGDRVKCHGYLKKEKIDYVTIDSFEDEDTFDVTKRVVIKEETEGIVIANRQLATKIKFTYHNEDVISVNDDEFMIEPRVMVETTDYVSCYLVATGMNRQRYVPHTMVEMIYKKENQL